MANFLARDGDPSQPQHSIRSASSRGGRAMSPGADRCSGHNNAMLLYFEHNVAASRMGYPDFSFFSAPNAPIRVARAGQAQRRARLDSRRARRQAHLGLEDFGAARFASRICGHPDFFPSAEAMIRALPGGLCSAVYAMPSASSCMVVQ
jgi:hypothetical protein